MDTVADTDGNDCIDTDSDTSLINSASLDASVDADASD